MRLRCLETGPTYGAQWLLRVRLPPATGCCVRVPCAVGYVVRDVRCRVCPRLCQAAAPRWRVTIPILPFYFGASLARNATIRRSIGLYRRLHAWDSDYATSRPVCCALCMSGLREMRALN